MRFVVSLIFLAHLAAGDSNFVFSNETIGLLQYNEHDVRHQLNLSQASYCIGSVGSWSCSTCNAGVSLEAVIQKGGGRALVGFDSNTQSLFVAYRGSEDIQNWINNIKFLKTSPYPDMPDVSVEKGFWSWYQDLKAGVSAALKSAASKHGVKRVTLTGHSAGAAVAALHAFDMVRGDSAFAGLNVTSLTTFGEPRVGNDHFAASFSALLVGGAIPVWRVTHYYDMVPHMPEEILGYQHEAIEVWYNEPSTSYKVCTSPGSDGEEADCSNSCSPLHCTSVSDHLDYLNTNLGTGAC